MHVFFCLCVNKVSFSNKWPWVKTASWYPSEHPLLVLIYEVFFFFQTQPLGAWFSYQTKLLWAVNFDSQPSGGKEKTVERFVF